MDKWTFLFRVAQHEIYRNKKGEILLVWDPHNSYKTVYDSKESLIEDLEQCGCPIDKKILKKVREYSSFFEDPPSSVVFSRKEYKKTAFMWFKRGFRTAEVGVASEVEDIKELFEQEWEESG